MLMMFVLAAGAVVHTECAERDWRMESERCAQAAGIVSQWEYARGQVPVLARRAGLKKSFFVRLGSNGLGRLAWSYPVHGGYGIAFDQRWLAKAPRTSVRVVAAHEVCHAVEGHLEHVQGFGESKFADALESDEHLAVSLCIINLVGASLYDAFLENQYSWDESARRLHHAAITKFRQRPRSRSR